MKKEKGKGKDEESEEDMLVHNSSEAGTSQNGPSAFSQASISQRRRSSAAHFTRPAGPPPQVPIPSVPVSREQTPDSLSDSPPRSMLNPGRPPSPQQDIMPDRLLLSPPAANPHPNSRPSSRRTLTRALELAREAVSLDGTNEDPQGAIVAYGRSVALLSEVMDRVRSGEDSTETRRGGRRRTLVAQEEEVRRLKSIHDTYADRMNILCLIYSIPPQPHEGGSLSLYSGVSESTESTQASSRSSSPSSDAGPSTQYTSEDNYVPNEYVELDFGQNPSQEDDDGTEAIGTAMFGFDGTNFGETTAREPSSESFHPYAAVYEPPVLLPTPSQRNSTLGRRRAGSNLPPPPPPPMNSLPPAPESLLQAPDIINRQLGHQRASSASRLSALQEDPLPHSYRQDEEETHIQPITPRHIIRDSHPLPPLPSPTTSSNSPGTPRSNLPRERPQTSPHGPSARRQSNASTHSNLINNSTFMGTISQRRNKGSSPRPASPTGSTASAGSIPVHASSLPNASSAIGMRARAISQPGRQPIMVGERVSSLDPRPPLPLASKGVSRSATQHKSNNVLALAVHTDIVPAQYLIPPPPVLAGNLPTTPTSPLPSIAPNDPLLKPYHMMSLLRTTMTSQTGGYVTRRLHVPQEVWSQGGAKLANILEKVKVVAILCQSLEELQASSLQYFSSGGMTAPNGNMSRKEGETWVAKMEEFSIVCDSVVSNFGKKLGVGEGFVTKKSTGVTSWVTRRFDKFTNGKNLDSPAAYVQGLKQLFLYAQLLDQHTKAIMSKPLDPTYAALPADIRMAVETKLKRSSEFFASVVLTFVVRDLSQLLDKYARKCEKWLAE